MGLLCNPMGVQFIFKLQKDLIMAEIIGFVFLLGFFTGGIVTAFITDVKGDEKHEKN